ncbi:GPI ethanolamine phosphate transferase 2 [Halotydeus destructor]|nr:GPI ethanolamine phosphate transferase 2 [Halotydeus destructor]
MISLLQNGERVTFLCMAVQAIGMLLFAYGYFVVDDLVLSQQELIDEKLKLSSEALLAAEKIDKHCSGSESKEEFSKLVFIVIDALRADFIPTLSRTNLHHAEVKETMSFTEGLLNHGQAIGIISEAQTPTVTMPRIKALLSGTIPSFVDLVTNLNAVKFGDDNLIQQAQNRGKRMVFYGDDTWLSMFPKEMFLRSEATSSFFATDYIQVDTNVTENVLPELKKLDEWDYMLLHYLGVDHIGHSHGGARSPLMKSKFIEMDNIVEAIWNAVSNSSERYLIAITGDHGMTDIGNHGGSTPEESNTALLFIDSKAFRLDEPDSVSVTEAKQIDFVVTASLLLGLPIPEKSKGKVIYPVLRKLNVTTETKLCHLFLNSMHLQKMKSTSSGYAVEVLAEALGSHAKFLLGSRISANEAVKAYLKYLNLKQESVMLEKSSNSQWLFVLSGIGLSFFSAYFLLLKESIRTTSTCMGCNLNSLSNVMQASHFVLYALFLQSTSFMEMEHFYWAYIVSSLVILNFCDSFSTLYKMESRKQQLMNDSSQRFSSILNAGMPSPKSLIAIQVLVSLSILALLKLVSIWSVHGNSIIGSWLSEKVNRKIMSALVILSFASIAFTLTSPKYGRQKCILVSGLFWVYLFRSDMNQLTSFKSLGFLFEIAFGFSLNATTKARLVYVHVIFLVIETTIRQLKPDPKVMSIIDNILSGPHPRSTNTFPSNQSLKKSSQVLRCLCCCLVLVAAVLSRVQNIPLIALNVLLEKLTYKACQSFLKPSRTLTLLTVYLSSAMLGFYSVGNSNLISTIDVAAGYVGLTAYQPLLVGLLMTCNTYAMYMFWLLMYFVRLDEARFSTFRTTRLERLMSSINFFLFIRFAIVGIYELISLFLQNHLFIWSVICPKLMYEGYLTLVTNLVVLIAFAAHAAFDE